ncbi:lipopolysaccharide biosynthesis regulator YciM [Neolewinella xylanilytica]|uniref:Lipopolysaccharide biosynthesis regulator YciM n=1 Tax=Neolewinella xylanilytica TaxID=1514080 RepID=A0A2S6I9J3_9BACT|nr:tetratricopeptide repeat protein [Neolewinella xylanilytica]PPK88142.1 lipopolysaccharide biosynthesis regulator YciM [Neolewinella xylanilytica]
MRTSLLLPILLFTAFLTAQAEMTEKAVNMQKAFIEAKQEALLGKTDEAIQLFEGILETDPENDPALFELARLQYAAGNTPPAIEALRRAYAIRPNDVYAAFLAELYQTAGRYQDGADLYASLIQRNPTEPENYLEQAAFLVRAQDIKGAIKVYETLEDRIGVNAELSRRKHALYVGTGDLKRAQRELEALIEAYPDQVEYRHLLAGFYRAQEDEKAAREVYQEILRIQPADVRAQLALQDAGRSAGKAGAGSDAELMDLLARTDVDLDLKIGKLLPLINEVASTNDRALADRALDLARELRRVHPDDAKAAAIVGDLYYHSGRLTEAADAYRATLELDDTVYPVWEQLLATLYLDNQSADLREYGEEALDIFPNRPSVYLYYALGEAFRGDYSEARNLLQQAQLMVSANPDAAEALTVVTAALSAMETRSGIGQIETAKLPGGPKAPMAVYLEQLAEPRPAALFPLDHPGNTNALLLELMGDVSGDAGDKDAATDYYRRAKAAGSKSASLAGKNS